MGKRKRDEIGSLGIISDSVETIGVLGDMNHMPVVSGLAISVVAAINGQERKERLESQGVDEAFTAVAASAGASIQAACQMGVVVAADTILTAAVTGTASTGVGLPLLFGSRPAIVASAALMGKLAERPCSALGDVIEQAIVRGSNELEPEECDNFTGSQYKVCVSQQRTNRLNEAVDSVREFSKHVDAVRSRIIGSSRDNYLIAATQRASENIVTGWQAVYGRSERDVDRCRNTQLDFARTVQRQAERLVSKYSDFNMRQSVNKLSNNFASMFCHSPSCSGYFSNQFEAKNYVFGRCSSDLSAEPPASNANNDLNKGKHQEDNNDESGPSDCLVM